MNNSMSMMRSSSVSNAANKSHSNDAQVNTDKRVVHKNFSYEKFRTRKVSRENS